MSRLIAIMEHVARRLRRFLKSCWIVSRELYFPIISEILKPWKARDIISRETGEERCWVVGHSDKATCQGILGEAVPRDAAIVYSDEYRSYHGLDLPHATVNHSAARVGAR